jgi:hypothetical protein
MTVYVDDMNRTALGRYRGIQMCHMIADSTEELLAMVDRIGVQRRWIQHAGTDREHFDIAQTKRALAVRAGAQEITMRELGRIIRAKRDRRLTASAALRDAGAAPKGPAET